MALETYPVRKQDTTLGHCRRTVGEFFDTDLMVESRRIIDYLSGIRGEPVQHTCDGQILRNKTNNIIKVRAVNPWGHRPVCLSLDQVSYTERYYWTQVLCKSGNGDDSEKSNEKIVGCFSISELEAVILSKIESLHQFHAKCSRVIDFDTIEGKSLLDFEIEFLGAMD